MKRKHEARIRTITEINAAKKSVPIVYGANVGKESVRITEREFSMAMLPDNYPADNPVILSHKNSSQYDSTELFWASEAEQLDRKYYECFRPLLAREDIDCVSVFAFAPQPLLVKLGTKLTDMHKVKVYQKHREPDTWSWQPLEEPNPMRIIRPKDKSKTPVLIFSLSATAISERVRMRYSNGASIWELTAEKPTNALLRSADQLVEFRKLARTVLDEINASTRERSINVFMAMPVACAVELGRVWMPKADKHLVLFDLNKSVGEFDIPTITIQ